jgi:hypothetical protein
MDISAGHRVTSRRQRKSPYGRSYQVVLAVGAALVVSVTLWASAASALGEPRTFSLLEVDATEAPLGDFTFDQAPAPGDQFTETNVLYRWAGAKSKGARVGRDRVLLTFVTGFGAKFTHRATILATAQMYLPDGTLMAMGYGNIPADGPHKFTVPIVGGTGVYANARGYMTTQGLGNGHTPRTKLDFHLQP